MELAADLRIGSGGGKSSFTEADLVLSDVTTNNSSTSKHGFLPKLSGNTSEYLNGNGVWATVTVTVTEAMLSFSDVSTANADASKHGLLPKLSANAAEYLNGNGVWATVTITESGISLSDVTTNDSSISKHGFLPKLSGISTQYLNGTGTWATVISGRELLTTDRTYYVRTDGNDSNDGSADDAAHAFLTLQKAVDTYQSLDCNIYNVTINVADGTYTAGCNVTGRVGTGHLYITGNTSTPANCIISVTGGDCFSSNGHPPGSIIYVNGFKVVTTTSGYGISAYFGSVINFSNIEFGACASMHLYAAYGAVIGCSSNYTISGSSQNHVKSQNQGVISVWGRTVTLTGTPAFSHSFVYSSYLSIVNAYSMTFSGSATGKRYTVDTNSIIRTDGGGATYFPGNVAGTTATGGLYI